MRLMLSTTGPVGIYSQGAGHGGAGGWEGPGDRIKGGGRALPNWPNRARAEGRPDDHWALLAQQGWGPRLVQRRAQRSLDEVCRKEALL